MLSKIYHALTARITFHKVNYYLRNMQKAGIEWKKVEGIWLPIWDEIGYDTLRWIVNGTYEIGEISILKKRLSSADIVLEIGTGLGFLSTYCALKNGNNQIYTYEANPDNVVIAQKVFNKNKVQPVMFNQILGETNGVIKFFVNDISKLASSIFKDTGQEKLIEQVSINNVIHKLKPTYLIMDIEGAEYDIFRIIDFQSIKKIQFELHPQLIGKEKTNIIFKILEKAGFLQDTEISLHPNYFFSKQ